MALAFDKLAPRERAGIVVAALFLAALVIEKGVIRTWLRTCRGLDVECGVLAKERVYAKGVLASEADIAGLYEGLRELAGVVTTPDEVVDGLKGRIDDMGRRTGVSLLSMEHRAPISEGSTELFTIVIGSYEADMRSLLAFLSDLEQASGMLRVAKLTVAPGKARGQVKGGMVITQLMIRQRE